MIEGKDLYRWMPQLLKPSLFMLTRRWLLTECKWILIKIFKVFDVEFWKYFLYLYLATNHICITCILLNKKCYYIRVLTFTCSKRCTNGWFRRYNSPFSIQDIMHKYQGYSNRNHPLIYNLCDHWFYPFTSCQVAKLLQNIILN